MTVTERQGDQEWINRFLEIALGTLPLVLAQFGVVQEMNTGFFKLGHELFVQALQGTCIQFTSPGTRGRQFIGQLDGLHAGACSTCSHLFADTGNPQHKEFIHIRAENSQKFDTFKQRSLLVFGLIEYTALKFEQAQISINVWGRIKKRNRFDFQR